MANSRDDRLDMALALPEGPLRVNAILALYGRAVDGMHKAQERGGAHYAEWERFMLRVIREGFA